MRKNLHDVGEEAGEARGGLGGGLELRNGLCLQPVAQRVSGDRCLVLGGEVSLLSVGVMSNGSGPPEVLIQSAVDLNARDDDVLAGLGGGNLGGSANLVQDAVVRRIGDSHKVGLLTIGQLAKHALAEEGHLGVSRVETDGKLGSINLAVERDEGTAGARDCVTARAPDFAHGTVRAVCDVGPNPEDVALLAIDLGGVCHTSAEASLAAEDKAAERGDAERLTPQAVKLLSERAADLITAGGHEVDRGLGVEAHLHHHLAHLLNELLLRDSAGEELVKVLAVGLAVRGKIGGLLHDTRMGGIDRRHRETSILLAARRETAALRQTAAGSARAAGEMAAGSARAAGEMAGLAGERRRRTSLAQRDGWRCRRGECIGTGGNQGESASGEDRSPHDHNHQGNPLRKTVVTGCLYVQKGTPENLFFHFTHATQPCCATRARLQVLSTLANETCL
jgi:hypothetical protein